MKVESFLGLKIILYFFIHILSVRNQRVGILSCYYDNDFSLINPIFTRKQDFLVLVIVYKTNELRLS